MKYVLITRPEPQAHLLAEHLSIPCFCEPMLIKAPLPYTIDWEGVTDVIITSARVFDHVASLPQNLHYWCVGVATAEAAKSQGLHQIVVGPGNVESLLKIIKARLSPHSCRFIYLRGKEVAVELDHILTSYGFQIQSIPVYDMISRPDMSSELKSLFQQGRIAIVPFYSVRTAETFKQLILQSHLAKTLQTITALALSDKIAQSLKQLPWQKIEINHNLVKSVLEAYNQLEDNDRKQI